MPDAPTVSRTLTLDSREEAVILFGPRDQVLKTLVPVPTGKPVEITSQQA